MVSIRQKVQGLRAGGGPHLVPRGPAVAPQACAAEYSARSWDSVGDIDRATWDALRGPDDIFMDVRLLRAVEESMSRDATFRYVLFRDTAGRPAASACLCTYAADATVLASEGPLHRLASMLHRVSPALVQYRIVFCGLPFSGGQSHLRFAPGADHRQVLRMLDAILREMARRSRAHCIVLKEFQAHELPALQSAAELGYRRADSLPMNQICLPEGDFEQYLAAMPHRRRHDIRKSLKKFAASGLTMSTVSDPDEIERLYTSEVHRLYEAVVARSETKLERLTPEFFRKMSRYLPENTEFCVACEGHAVRGIGLCLFSDQSYHPLFMGVDYSRNRESDLYFNLVYRSIADSMRRGTSHMELGQNADHFKQTKLGAVQTPRYFYIKGAGIVMDAVIRLLFKQLFPPRPIGASVAAA